MRNTVLVSCLGDDDAIEGEDPWEDCCRPGIQCPVDPCSCQGVGGVEVVASLARGQVPEDGLRLGKHELAVANRRYAAEWVQLQIPVRSGSGARDRHVLELKAEFGEQ